MSKYLYLFRDQIFFKTFSGFEFHNLLAGLKAHSQV